MTEPAADVVLTPVFDRWAFDQELAFEDSAAAAAADDAANGGAE